MTAQLRAEFLRHRTTRTSLGLFLATLGLILLAMLLHALALPGDTLAPRHNQLIVLGVGERLGVLFAALLGAVAITGEFRHGTIRPTLLVTPRRGRVIAAKVGVSVFIGAVFGLAGSGVAAAVGSAALQVRGIDLTLTGGDVLLLLAGSAAAGALWAAIGVGLGAMVRNQVPTLIGISAWLLFVEGLLVETSPDVTAVGRFGPGAAAAAISGQGADVLLPPATALLLLVAYAAAVALIGWLATARRDIP